MSMKLLGDAFMQAVPRFAGQADADLSGRMGDFLTVEALSIEVFRRRLHGMMCGAETAERMIAKGRVAARKLAAAAESPIEAMMAPALVFADYDGFESTPADVVIPKEMDGSDLGDVFIVPQFAFVRYRADFAIFGEKNGNRKIVVLECDGEDFHADRKKDWDRDRFFEAFGISVVRASGREIYEGAVSVAARVATELSRWASEQ